MQDTSVSAPNEAQADVEITSGSPTGDLATRALSDLIIGTVAYACGYAQAMQCYQ